MPDTDQTTTPLDVAATPGDDYTALAGRNFASPNWNDYYVTAEQLRKALADVPDEAIVVLAKDAEGNGFSPLSLGDPKQASVAWYVPESTWAGEVYQIGPYDDGEEYEPDGSELFAVVLDPVN